jgi:hypothetical protein
MARKKRELPLKLGDRARNRLNRRVGTIDAVEEVGGGRRRYGLHYEEEPQDHWIAAPQRDGASLPADLIERA